MSLSADNLTNLLDMLEKYRQYKYENPGSLYREYELFLMNKDTRDLNQDVERIKVPIDVRWVIDDYPGLYYKRFLTKKQVKKWLKSLYGWTPENFTTAVTKARRWMSWLYPSDYIDMGPLITSFVRNALIAAEYMKLTYGAETVDL